jgi:SAM-dependent methyltransferase
VAVPLSARRARAPFASAVVDLLRSLRTAALWAAGPVERLWRGARGRGDLPPLWLRRHVGPVGRFESAARETAALIDRLALVGEGSRVVDLGCGCGAMVPALAERAGAGGGYLGIDVHAPSLAWCRRRWAGEPRVRFASAGVRSPYGGRSGAPPAALRLPVDDGAADFVLAKSLLTHLVEDELRAYLREIARLLAPGGAALVTLFLFDGERFAAAPPPAFPHPEPGAPVRWRRRHRPHAAVAFERRWLLDRLAEAGLAVAHDIPGFFPGEAAAPTGQDVLVLRKYPPVSGAHASTSTLKN